MAQSEYATEARRLAHLDRLRIMDTPAEAAFDELVILIAGLCEVPTALISLVDDRRQWFKARVGMEATGGPRSEAFCAHAIRDDALFLVEDTHLDPRFAENPQVISSPMIRAYAGAPLTTSLGTRLGTLCIIDHVPRTWTEGQKQALKSLARMATNLIEMRADTASNLASLQRLETRQFQDQHVRTMFATLREGLVLQDADGKIIEANPSAAAILGLSEEQLLGRTSMDPRWMAIYPDGSPFSGENHPSMVCLQTGEPVNDVTMGVRLPDGGERWISISAQPIFDETETLPMQVVVTFFDISDVLAARRQLTEKQRSLEVALAAAEAASEAKSNFLANMSHEIRTPLNGVTGMASALMRTELDPRQTEMVSLMVASGRSLETILNDILDLSKLDAGAVELEVRPFDLRAEMMAAAQLVAVRADGKGVNFRTVFGPAATGHVLGDAVRLKQVISNLVSNAVKFTDQGDVCLEVDLVDIPGQGSRLEVEVRDTGIGFSEEVQRSLFERFSQADESITRRYGGTGLGLPICKALVELQGGAISANSIPGEGSCFRFWIPIRRSEAEAGPDPEVHDLSLKTAVQLLLVEDHPTNQRVVQLLLEPYDIEVTIASDGAEAVNLVRDRAFDVILMDMQMPIMDGLAATKAIREFEAQTGRPRTPIAMMTANTYRDHQQMAETAGTDLFLPKPINAETLLSALEVLLTDPEPATRET